MVKKFRKVIFILLLIYASYNNEPSFSLLNITYNKLIYK